MSGGHLPLRGWQPSPNDLSPLQTARIAGPDQHPETRRFHAQRDRSVVSPPLTFGFIQRLHPGFPVKNNIKNSGVRSACPACYTEKALKASESLRSCVFK